MATIGQPLTAPETGWKRYEDNLSYFVYSGNGWSSGTNASASGSNWHQLNNNTTTSSVKFKFYGTKIRVISWLGSAYTPESLDIHIDGENNTFTINTGSVAQALVFEKTNLPLGFHQVEIIQKPFNGLGFLFDAVDIDDTGRLLHPDEVIDVKDLHVGKRIRFNYSAANGTVGTFSNLGKETGNLIPPASSATPNGDAYFVMVDRDFKGRKILIADRNIQHSISWDTLNTAGVASGSGVPIYWGVIPPLTSFSSDVANVSSSSQADATNYVAWKAFDGLESTYWSTQLISKTTEGILTIEFQSPKVINRYFIHAKYSPRDWLFEGSNNNSTWTVLHTGYEASTWDNQKKSYSFVNSTPYKYYRVRAIYHHGDYNGYFTVQLYSPNDSMYDIRLPTGGISSSDTDNEWDKYVVNSTLNESIIAGNNDTWNWSGVYSWTSTTNTYANTNRTLRGNTSAGAQSYTVSSNTWGFRPVMIIEEIPITKTLLYYANSYKSYKNNQWNTVSISLPDTVTFKNEGNDMTDFDRKVKTFTQSMGSGTVLGSGKMFKSTVDFKKYIEILKIEIK